MPLGGLIVFPTLIGAAFVLRRRTAFHKRLMLLGTIEMLNAAVDRLPGVYDSGLAPFYLGTDIFLIALLLYDIVTLRPSCDTLGRVVPRCVAMATSCARRHNSLARSGLVADTLTSRQPCEAFSDLVVLHRKAGWRRAWVSRFTHCSTAE